MVPTCLRGSRQPRLLASVRRRRAAARGFTLAEVLAVLAVIAVLAAVATPGFVEMVRERRTQHETAMISDTFRTARARALGRGAAVRVRMFEDPPGAIVEELVSADVNALPIPSCAGTGTWRLVGQMQGRPGSSELSVYLPGEVSPETGISVCYTPRGRTYLGQSGGFTLLEGVLDVRMRRTAGNYTDAAGARSIFVMPNGLVRVAL